MPGAEDLHDRAKQAFNRGAFSRATRLLDLAEKATDDPDLTARINLTRAYAEAETGSRVRRGRALQPGARPDIALGRNLRSGLGRSSACSACAAATAEPCARGLSGCSRPTPPPGGHADIGLVFLNRGNVYLQSRDVSSRGSRLHAGPRRAHPRGGTQCEHAKAEHNLGYARAARR